MDNERAIRFGQQLRWVGGALSIGIGGLLVFTNPSHNAYEEYATEKLTDYLKENVCTKVSQPLGNFLQSHCKTLVDTGRPQIQELIAQQTTRQNYLLFSIYRTELSLPSPVPAYHFATFGAFQNFYIYEAEEL
jgi:hypothetical protein